MHHALEVDEILRIIFSHCDLSRPKSTKHGRPLGVSSDLVSLARTCRTFKEPALDMLWSELPDLSPLARCLPKATYQLDPGFQWYSFHRPLERAEWATLRSYTRRVRSILDFGSGFHAKCVKTFLNPPTSEPLFPNLRHIRCIFANETAPLLRQLFPSLVSLDYSFIVEGNLSLFQGSLDTFPVPSSDMRNLSIRVRQPEANFDKAVSDYICRWSNPQTVYCPQITLGADALMHLSRVGCLSQLSFALGPTVPDEIGSCDGSLLFSKLQELKLYSEYLSPLSALLDHILLPAVTDFSVQVGSCPGKQEVASFMSSLQKFDVGDSLTSLELLQVRRSPDSADTDPVVLISNDLRPCMTFRNIRHIDVNLGWSVGLGDDDLLELVSAWPRLEDLLINQEWGWQTAGGVTPGGLVRVLRKCPSLSRVALALDTRGYTEAPSKASPAYLGLDLPDSFAINVLDSVIEADSVPAVAAFFAAIVPCASFSFSAWRSWAFTWRSNKMAYVERWGEVYGRACEAVVRRSG